MIKINKSTSKKISIPSQQEGTEVYEEFKDSLTPDSSEIPHDLSSGFLPALTPDCMLEELIGDAVEEADNDRPKLIRMDVDVTKLVPNAENPNVMSEQEFNMLYDNVERMGITDPILVRPLVGEVGAVNCTYKIVGGHHRWEVAKLIGLEEVPCTIICDPKFDEDMERFQMVRHNVIHGRMDAKKFMNLYQQVQGRYTEELAAEMFGFAKEEEFKKLIASTAASLPSEMKQQFIDATKEIKTIDDLAMVLNRLFTTYGDTVPWGFMIFDFGGQDHTWIRMEKHQKKEFLKFSDWCVKNERTVDKVIALLLRLASEGTLDGDEFMKEFEKLPKVTITEAPEGRVMTEDYLATLQQLDEM
jgi:hypothetical protein